MKYKRIGLYLLLSFFLFWANLGWAQHTIHGKIISERSNLPLGLAILKTHEECVITDASGAFNMWTHMYDTVQVSHPDYESVEFVVPPNPLDTIILKLKAKLIPLRLTLKPDEQARRIMMKAWSHKSMNDPKKRSGFTYKSYNKLVVHSDNAIKLAKTYGKFFKWILPGVKNINDRKHLAVMESYTEGAYKNEWEQREDVNAVRVSGAETKGALALASTLTPFSVYDDEMSFVGGLRYVSPLSPMAPKWYTFALVDSIQTRFQTIYRIAFNYKKNREDNALQGYIYISNIHYAVVAILAEPVDLSSIEVQYFEFFQLIDHQTWFPRSSKIQLYIEKVSNTPLHLSTSYITYYYDVNIPVDFKERKFDDVILRFETDSVRRIESYWTSKRQEPMTNKEKETLINADPKNQLTNLDKLLGLGDRIYAGKIPLKYVEIDVNRIFNFNDYEKTRWGFGMHTTPTLYRKCQIGGYVGRGNGDQIWKYGGDIVFPIGNFEQKLMLAYDFAYEEPGLSRFAFDRIQYSSEPLRKYRSNSVDLTHVTQFTYSIHPIKYLDLMGNLAYTATQPKYAYAFKDSTQTQYSLMELKLGGSYAFGDQLIHLGDKQYRIQTKLPVFWFHIIKGLAALDAKQDYTKIEGKLQYTTQVLGLPKTGIQFTGGFAWGSLPYFSLFHAKGSNKAVYALIHNSFETMFYNEFVLDQYATLHISQEVVRFKFLPLSIKPWLEVLQNIGWGNLSNPNDHKFVQIKTMEKGFFETGAFVNDLVAVRTLGIKTSIGCGVFARYGPNALPGFRDNLLFKFSLTFGV